MSSRREGMHTPHIAFRRDGRGDNEGCKHPERISKDTLLAGSLLILSSSSFITMQVAAGYVLHVGTMSRGTLKLDAVISAEVDHVRRERIVPNHTFTHVLNFALREVRHFRTC